MNASLLRRPLTVAETEHQLIVKFDVTGFTRSNLTVELAGRDVTVEGHGPLLDELRESVRLPDDVDPAHVVVYYDRGVLELHAPKRPIRVARRLPVVDKPRGLRWAEAESRETASARAPVGLGLD
jgi:HSP20 family molecular chaperone IbpA